jgi:hypothetical protein
MKQKIMCQKGRCYEEDTLETQFDSLFDDSNIVEQIQHDIMNYMMK